MRHACINAILYADDILLLAPSVGGLQQMLIVCETEINVLGLNLIHRKSVCMHVGPRYMARCVIKTINGNVLNWVTVIR